MCKGPGSRQKAILEAVGKHGSIFLDTITADRGAEYKAFYRAACKLHEAGRIGFKTFAFGGGPKVVISVVGHPGADRNQLRRLHEQQRAHEIAADRPAAGRRST